MRILRRSGLVSKGYQHERFITRLTNVISRQNISIIHAFLIQFGIGLSSLIPIAARSQNTGPWCVQEPGQTTYCSQDSLEIADFLAARIVVLNGEGYLAATSEYSELSDSVHTWNILSGKQYTWSQVGIDSLILRQNRWMALLGEKIDTKQLNRLKSTTLRQFETRGFPFARLNFSPSHSADSAISIKLAVEPGPFIPFDSVIVKSNDEWKPSYFSKILNIKKGAPYDQTKIDAAESILKNQTFVKSVRPVQVLFTGEGARTYLYLEKAPANRFNGIIGIQQNEQSDQTVITGQVDLYLINTLKRGEWIDLKWQRLQASAQNLEVEIAYPYILNSDFGVAGNLQIIRQDSTFSSVVSGAGVVYQFNGLQRIKAFAENRRTTDLDTQGDLNESTRVLAYGLGTSINYFDQAINPSKGWGLNLTTSVGNREFKDEQSTSNSIQWKALVDVMGILKISNSFSAATRLQGGIIESNQIFTNEALRIGGYNTMRGFDESSLFVNQFYVASEEVRFRFEEFSYAFVFADLAFADYSSDDSRNLAQLSSLGAGLSLNTQSGIFSLNYAIGQTPDSPILFRNAKIHFAFSSVF